MRFYREGISAPCQGSHHSPATNGIMMSITMRFYREGISAPCQGSHQWLLQPTLSWWGYQWGFPEKAYQLLVQGVTVTSATSMMMMMMMIMKLDRACLSAPCQRSQQWLLHPTWWGGEGFLCGLREVKIQEQTNSTEHDQLLVKVVNSNFSNMGGTGLHFESWKVHNLIQTAPKQHFYCFLREMWILETSHRRQSPTHGTKVMLMIMRFYNAGRSGHCHGNRQWLLQPTWSWWGW